MTPDRIILRYSHSAFIYPAVMAQLLYAVTVLFAVTADGLYILYPIAVTLTLGVIMTVKAVKEWQRLKETVVISPEGILLPDKTLIAKADIDRCYLHFCYFTIREIRWHTVDKSFYRLMILKTDGEEKKADLRKYRISRKDAVSFPDRVNAMAGMPKFTESVIEDF